ncbi:MAG: thioredoxin family protein [Planctomycetia bacterium]|nr:thioredoxin family protein [Planctomycetia bacterium]
MRTTSVRWLSMAGFVLSACLCSAALADDKLWSVDFDEAKDLAGKDKKDILMEFTGSDWCPPCIALHENVLSKEHFQAEAPKHFVLLKLDNPNDKSKQTEKEIEQYKTLSAQFQITGVPTIILADSAGRPYAKIVGYGGDDAEKYTKKLVDQIEQRTKRDDYLAKADKAKGLARARLLAQAIDGIDSELTLTTYRETVDEIIKLDAKDEAGLKTKYEGLVKLVDLKKQLQDIQRNTRDAAEIVKKVDALIEQQKPTGEGLQEALYVKGAALYRTDKAASKKILEEAMAAAPDTEKGQRLKGILERAFKEEPKAEKKEGDK